MLTLPSTSGIVYWFAILFIFRLISFIFFLQKKARKSGNNFVQLDSVLFLPLFKKIVWKKDKETKHRANCVTIVKYQSDFPRIQAFFYMYGYSVQWRLNSELVGKLLEIHCYKFLHVSIKQLRCKNIIFLHH